MVLSLAKICELHLLLLLNLACPLLHPQILLGGSSTMAKKSTIEAMTARLTLPLLLLLLPPRPLLQPRILGGAVHPSSEGIARDEQGQRGRALLSRDEARDRQDGTRREHDEDGRYHGASSHAEPVRPAPPPLMLLYRFVRPAVLRPRGRARAIAHAVARTHIGGVADVPIIGHADGRRDAVIVRGGDRGTAAQHGSDGVEGIPAHYPAQRRRTSLPVAIITPVIITPLAGWCLR
mmetsp:Transcript_27657/g.66640  ORF Transcript_27657/g.66640 Transcript_27657/m.66640 type:complete len:235 (+) Transcript_27657:207-911(+)